MHFSVCRQVQVRTLLLSVYRQVHWPSMYPYKVGLMLILDVWVCIAFWFIYQNIRSLSTFWIDYATCLNGLVSSIFLRPISVGSVSIHWCSRYSMYPDSLTTQMYSSSMIYGSLNRSYPRFIHIRVECTLLQKSFFVQIPFSSRFRTDSKRD